MAFDLGNTTYDDYNAMMNNVDSVFRKLGANRIGDTGKGGDAGTMGEDFLTLKEPMWAALATTMGLKEREAVYQPTFSISELENLTPSSMEVYLGEPNEAHLQAAVKGPFDCRNPDNAPLSKSYELFSTGDRNYLHMEFDLSGSDVDLSYRTGDHLAVWPANPSDEVDRLLRVLGLSDKRHSVIGVTALESTKVPFPTPTTYESVFRHYLEICAPVSRQLLSTLAVFSPTNTARDEMTRLGNDKDYFHEHIGPRFFSIARFLEHVAHGETWPQIPFSAIIESLGKLQPRYYSISSSSLLQPKQVSITAVVENKAIPGLKDPFRGVATNYLLNLKKRQNGEPSVENQIASKIARWERRYPRSHTCPPFELQAAT